MYHPLLSLRRQALGDVAVISSSRYMRYHMMLWWFERKYPSPHEVALLGGLALLEEVCNCGG